jgi:hypothetical protein
MSFRIGRKFASHTYPEASRGGSGNPLTAFARNFAVGPATDTPVVTTGTQILWGTVDVPDINPQNVPITPRSTGVVRVSGSIIVQNTGVNPATVVVQVQVNGVATPAAFAEAPIVTIDPANGIEETSGFESIPLLVELTGLVIGTKVDVQILVGSFTDGIVFLTAIRSTIDVQEVAVATG